MNIMRVKSDRNNLSYLYPFIPREVASDAALQGQVFNAWINFKNHIDTCQKNVAISYPMKPYQKNIFAALLSRDPSFIVEITPEGLSVTSKKRVSEPMPVKSKKTASTLVSIETTYEKAGLMRRDLKTILKLGACISKAIKGRNRFVEFKALGSDRAFLAEMMRTLFKNAVESVTIDKSNAGRMCFVLQENSKRFREERKEAKFVLSALEKELEAPSQNEQYEYEESADPSPEEKYPGSSSRECFFEMMNNQNLYEYAVAYKEAELCRMLHLDPKSREITSDNLTYFAEKLGKADKCHPFFDACNWIFDELCNDSEIELYDEEIAPFEKLRSAKNFREILKIWYEAPDGLRKYLLRRSGGIKMLLWMETVTHGHFNFHSLIEGSLLKKEAETVLITPKNKLSMLRLSSIPTEQIVRSYMTSESPTPLITILINGQEVSFSEFYAENSKKRQRAYIFQLVNDICQALGWEVKEREIFSNILTNDLLSGKATVTLMPKETPVLQILQMGSFSWMSHADKNVRDIFLGITPGGYSIKYVNPQEKPSCLVDIESGSSFSVKRTASYSLRNEKNGEDAYITAECITHLQEGKLTSSIRFPLIRFHPLVPRDQQHAIMKALIDKGSKKSVK